MHSIEAGEILGNDEKKINVNIFQNKLDESGGMAQNAASITEGFPSGQRDQTVNLTAQPSEVRILPPPPNCSHEMQARRVRYRSRTPSAPEIPRAGVVQR